MRCHTIRSAAAPSPEFLRPPSSPLSISSSSPMSGSSVGDSPVTSSSTEPTSPIVIFAPTPSQYQPSPSTDPEDDVLSDFDNTSTIDHPDDDGSTSPASEELLSLCPSPTSRFSRASARTSNEEVRCREKRIGSTGLAKLGSQINSQSASQRARNAHARLAKANAHPLSQTGKPDRLHSMHDDPGSARPVVRDQDELALPVIQTGQVPRPHSRCLGGMHHCVAYLAQSSNPPISPEVVYNDTFFAPDTATPSQVRYLLTRLSCDNADIFDRHWRAYLRHCRQTGAEVSLTRESHAARALFRELNEVVVHCPSRPGGVVYGPGSRREYPLVVDDESEGEEEG